jgi:hypothetical protein
MSGAPARHPANRLGLSRPEEREESHKASGDRTAAAGRVTFTTTSQAKLEAVQVLRCVLPIRGWSSSHGHSLSKAKESREFAGDI